MRLLLALLFCLLPATLVAQESDRDWLTAYIEDNLSDAGREVRIVGFRGALSSRATFDSLTIADDDGVWLTITDGAISWDRTELFSGRIEIGELSAASVDLPRAPNLGGGAKVEASGFSLPVLPVGINIGLIRVDRVSLGAPLLGQAAEISVQGSASLADGEGTASLEINRLDGPAGEVSLTAAYSNANDILMIDLLVSEAPDGIAATLIGLPGRPSVMLAVNGSGPLDNFRADISLSTDAVQRLKGTVALLSSIPPGGGPAQRHFRAQLGGDISPLFRPEYRAFFGDSVQLVAEGVRAPSGELTLSTLEIDAEALDLSGQLVLAPDGLPKKIDLELILGLDSGDKVLLPLAAKTTSITGADLKVTFDAAAGDAWTLDGEVRGLSRPDLDLAAIRLSGSGRIARTPESLIGGTLEFAAGGLALADPDLAAAVGTTLTGRAIFFRQGDAPLSVPSFRVTGQDYAARGGFVLSGLDSGLTVQGRAEAQLYDLARLSGLAGRPLAGQAQVGATGAAGILSGIFDLSATVEGADLRVDQTELDRLLAGLSRASISVRRDTDGIEIRALTLATRTLTAELSGLLRTGTSALQAKLDSTDLSVLGRGWHGTLSAEAALAEAGGTRRLTVSALGDALGIGNPSADRVLAGRTSLSLIASQTDGRIAIENLELSNPQLTVSATGLAEAGRKYIDLQARLDDLALLAPDFPGPLTTTGRLTESGDGYILDLDANGPGGTSAQISGTVAQNFRTANLAITGAAQAALANAFIAPRSVQGPVNFNLVLNGPPALASLSGTLSLLGGRIAAPVLGYSLEATDATVRLAGGSADLTATARIVGGGSLAVSGPVGLSPPFPAELTVRVSGARLRNPQLFESTVDGVLTITGPLNGGGLIAGTLDLGETQVRIPATGLGGLAPIPDITHLAEPADSRATRARAGLLDRPTPDGGRVARAFALDIALNAPRRIFVRGRGLDAELGGALRLQGTTVDIIPSGQFELVRGRLDILGKRLNFDEGLVQLQGDFVPYIRFVARTTVEDITVTITIEGLATEPAISVTSTPELPEEEVLSLLLFGRDLTSISPLQAARLAAAVATLAGRGGEGIVGRLRESFGLDDLDITTDADGNAALRVGKYLSENVYTDITVGSDGKSQINLNLDVSPNVTVRGTFGPDGNSGIGVYYERDY